MRPLSPPSESLRRFLRWIAAAGVGAALVLPTPANAEGGAAEDLAWLQGCWRSQDGERSTEECWMEPRGNLMLAVHRSISPRGASFEFLRIADEGDGLTYFAAPGGRSPATPFRLVEMGEQRVVFANPEHDFPQRISYWREGEELRARVDGEVDGEVQALGFSWSRAPAIW